MVIRIGWARWVGGWDGEWGHRPTFICSAFSMVLALRPGVASAHGGRGTASTPHTTHTASTTVTMAAMLLAHPRFASLQCIAPSTRLTSIRAVRSLSLDEVRQSLLRARANMQPVQPVVPIFEFQRLTLTLTLIRRENSTSILHAFHIH